MKNLKISTQMIFLMASFVVIAVAIAGYSIYEKNKAHEFMEQMYSENLVIVDDLSHVSESVSAIGSIGIYKVLTGEFDWPEFYSYTQEHLKGAESIIDKVKEMNNEASFTENFEILNNFFNEAKRSINNINDEYNMNDSIDDKYIKFSNIANSVQIVNSYVLEIDDILSRNAKGILQASEDRNNKSKRMVIILMTIIGIGISIPTYMMLKNISNTINDISKNIEDLAKGNLSIKIKSTTKNEFGVIYKNLQSFNHDITKTLIKTHNISKHILNTAFAMNQSSQEISQGATENAANAEEIAANMEQISANIEQNSTNSIETNDIAKKAAQEIEIGYNQLTQTVEAMKTIAKKVSIIGEIANQTNLLALNAAVEAARAGEHGKGFGVVAAEVGKLADRSKKAASEIDELSNSGVVLAEKTQEVLNDFVPKIKQTSNLIQEINNSSIEQKAGAEQINTAMQLYNQVTQQNAASSEELATVAEELNAQSEELVNNIAFFKLSDDQLNQKEDMITKRNPTKKLITKNTNEVVDVPKGEPQGININLDAGSGMDDSDFEKF